MPPALASGPLLSARMALRHTAYQLPPGNRKGVGWGPLFLTHRHKHTQTQMHRLLAPGLCIGIHAELMAIKPSRKLIWRTHKDTCCQRGDHTSERSGVLAQLRLLKNKKPLFSHESIISVFSEGAGLIWLAAAVYANCPGMRSLLNTDELQLRGVISLYANDCG